MATCWVTEYAAGARTHSGGGADVPTGMEPAVVVQSFPFTGAAQSAAFGPGTRFVRVYSSADCRVAFGEDPEAVAGSTPLTGKVGEYFGVVPGHKLSIYDGVT
jgi:hypothetical protein